ncbi:MAG: hypothetical protein HQL27_02595 [Candidatus Omnitrophica bacterium]|nr:hypothetical protein [Candidatus Omnitrophota bacterium]
MKFFADFHVHSHFSLATSGKLTPEYLEYWARLKGLSVIGTGDFTHPGWVEEIKEKLFPAEDGLYRLKDCYLLEESSKLPSMFDSNFRFILSSEISTIYKKHGKVRKVHNIVIAPDFETVERIQRSLNKFGANIASDGRPIIGMDCKDLLNLCLEASADILFTRRIYGRHGSLC